MRVSYVVMALALTSAGCESGPKPQVRAAEARRIEFLAQFQDARKMNELRAAVQNPADVTPAGWFELGAIGGDAENAAETIEKDLPAGAPPDMVAAAAMGLAMCKSDATERVLVALALRPSHPPEAVEALFSYYRWRGDKPSPTTLPDAKLFEFEHHPTARGRAALAHLGRNVKDPALIPVLERLSKDDDVQVRHAVALSLADGLPKTPRAKADAARCLDLLASLLHDRDAGVVASACKATSSYDDPKSPELLASMLTHADFNVRVAALEGLGHRTAKNAIEAMANLAKSDPSVSVRYTAAEQLLVIDPNAAQKLVDGLLADSSEYVQTAGVDILAKSDDPAAIPRLAALAKSDPQIRVREQAVGAFEGKKDSPVAKEAIRGALADKDAIVVATACGVVAKNEWKDMAGLVAAVPARFPRCAGADAREAAISALSDLDGAANRPLFEAHLTDANPAVRAAAEKAIESLETAKASVEPRSPQPTRGADLTGELLPGGAPMFDQDVFLIVETDQGTMKIRLFPEQAPVHCAHVAALARTHFYDGLTWHRVVPDFVIQGGCPRGDGSGNAGVTLPLEPTRIPFERGTLGMPRGEHPDTGGCQLFICHSRAPHLDVRYTAFGKVVEGFDVIDKIDVDSKILHVRVEGAR